MSRTKEQRIYLEGIAFAYKIAKEQGIESLEKEVKFRGANNCVLNVNYSELVAVTRGRCKDELMYVATASAVTLSEVLKLPPSRIKKHQRKPKPRQQNRKSKVLRQARAPSHRMRKRSSLEGYM